MLIRNQQGIAQKNTSFAGVDVGSGKASDLDLVFVESLMSISPAPGMSLSKVIFNADGGIASGKHGHEARTLSALSGMEGVLLTCNAVIFRSLI